MEKILLALSLVQIGKCPRQSLVGHHISHTDLIKSPTKNPPLTMLAMPSFRIDDEANGGFIIDDVE
jgi:hypothetical protein